MKQFIAERRLLYSLKGSNDRKEFFIRIGIPYLVKEGDVNFNVGKDGCAASHVEIDGLNEVYGEIYGADTLQASNIASNVEPFLKRLQKKYDIFFPNGESYFDS